MTNWMARSLGSMMLRPGLGFITQTNNGSQAYTCPFIFSAGDTALLEFTVNELRPLVGEQPITRVSVATAVTNGGFGTDLSGWTDASDSGCSTAWATGGYAELIGSGGGRAVLKQTVTVAGGDTGKRHALRVVIKQGKVGFKVGSIADVDDYVADTGLLGIGTHSLAFTPTGNFVIEFYSFKDYPCLVDSCNIEAAGILILPSPYGTPDMPNIRWGQSADVVYLACRGFQQRKIERRATDSWSLVLYQTEDGPFRVENFGTITITADAIKGAVNLTASAPLWYAQHVGSLFRLASFGQDTSNTLSGASQFGDPIKVTGVGDTRNFTWAVTGTYMATLVLQQGQSEVGPWTDTGQTVGSSGSYNDQLDNDELWYRIGIESAYTSGSAIVAMSYAGGSINGIVLITGYTDSQHVAGIAFAHLGGTAATSNWWEGIWSDYRGWPSARR